MGDQIQKAPEAEPALVTPVLEEPHESHSLRKENVRGILAGRSFSAKLGAADDPAESQADSLANAALSKSISASATAESTASQTATSSLKNRPLSTAERNFFEPRFSTDFSGVRLNYSSESSSLARQVNARAFTLGSDIHFSNPSINFNSDSGRKTLAHELAHVVQNKRTSSNENVIRREVDITGRVEYSTRYRNSEGEARDNAEEIELGVLVRVFYNLQQAGLIPESEHLGDDLNGCQRAAMGTIMDEMGVSRGITGCSVPTTYEAALRILVTDADDNGRFDIDIDALYRSRLTNLSQTSCVDTGVIERAINAQLDPTDDWLDDQSDDADHSNDFFGQSTQFVNRFGGLTDEGDAVRSLDDGYVITDIERYYWQARNTIRGFAEENDHESVVSNAITAATDLQRVGGWEEAAQLMAFGFRSAVNSQTLTERLLASLAEGQPLSRILNETVDIRLTSELQYEFDRNEDIEIREDSSDFDITLAQLVGLVQERSSFVSTVAESVQGSVSQTPSLQSMTQHMHQLVSTATLEQVKTALGNALSSQFVHSGGGVDYEGFPGATRSSNIQGLYDALSQDGAGRFVIDCDGFVALARHFLDDGSNRFRFLFMDKRTRDVLRENVYRGNTHAMMAVMEMNTGQGFIVNNHNVHGEFTFDPQGSFTQLFSSIGIGLRAIGYTNQYTRVFIADDQSIYDAGDDPNRWEWPNWRPSDTPESTPEVEESE